MSGREWSSPDLRDMHSDLMRLREHHLGGKRWRDLLHGAADMLLAADAELLATPRTDAGEVERLREALEASLAKRSQPTMDPLYTAAFNAALDMVERDTAAARAALAPSVGGDGWKTIDSAPKDGTQIDVWWTRTPDGYGQRVTDALFHDGAWRKPCVFDADEVEDDERFLYIGGIGLTTLIETSLCKVTHWMPLPSAPSRARDTA